MPTTPLKELKPQYLEFIDLLRECRRHQLGKKGLTHVPKDAIDTIAPKHKISRYIRQLVDDGVLQPLEGTTPPKLFAIDGEGAEATAVFHCAMTIEEMQNYRRSLLGVQSGTAAFYSVPSWEGVTIRFITEREVVIKTPSEQRQTDFAALGFVNHKNGKPNSAWMFLFGLSMNGGETPALSNPIPDNVKQHKRALSKQLQEVFGLDSDPFYSYRDQQTYKIKVALEPPVEVRAESGELTEE